MKIEKIVFVTEEDEKVVPYDPQAHGAYIRKFVVVEGGLIITGARRDGDHVSHRRVVSAYVRSSGDRSIQWSSALVGAGNALNGSITGWESEGFRITTPEELRPIIRKALGLESRLGEAEPAHPKPEIHWHQAMLMTKAAEEEEAKEQIFEKLGELERFCRTAYENLTEEARAEISATIEKASQLAYATIGHFDTRSPASYNFFWWAKKRFGFWNDSHYTNRFHDWRTLRHIAVVHCELLIESACGDERETRFHKRLAGEWMEEMGYWADAIKYLSDARGYYAWSGEFVEDWNVKKRLERLHAILAECRPIES